MSVPALSRPPLLSAAAPAGMAPVGGVTGNNNYTLGAMGGMGMGAQNSTTFFGISTDNQTLSSHTNAPIVVTRKQYLQHKNSELERIYTGEAVWMCPPVKQRRAGGSMAVPSYPRSNGVMPLAPVHRAAFRSWSAMNKILYEHPLEYDTATKVFNAFKFAGICLQVGVINPEETSMVNDYSFTTVTSSAHLGTLGYSHQCPDVKPGDVLVADLVRFDRFDDPNGAVKRRLSEAIAASNSASASYGSKANPSPGLDVKVTSGHAQTITGPRRTGIRNVDAANSNIAAVRAEKAATYGAASDTKESQTGATSGGDAGQGDDVPDDADENVATMAGSVAQQPSKKKKKLTKEQAVAVKEQEHAERDAGLNTSGFEASSEMSPELTRAEHAERYYWQWVPKIMSVKDPLPMPGNLAQGWTGKRLKLGTIHSVTPGSASFSGQSSFVHPRNNSKWIDFAPYVGKIGLLVNASV